MSREFGNYMSGYFHDKIREAANDALQESKNPLTNKWGAVLETLYDVAYAISSYEASDSGFDYPIMESIESLPKLKKQLADIEQLLRPYKDVMEAAIRAKLDKDRA